MDVLQSSQGSCHLQLQMQLALSVEREGGKDGLCFTGLAAQKVLFKRKTPFQSRSLRDFPTNATNDDFVRLLKDLPNVDIQG